MTMLTTPLRLWIPDPARVGSSESTPSARRARRVALLLAAVVAMSLLDLAFTLAYLETTGLAEGNPIARHLVQATNSSFALIAFKLFTVLVSVSVLYPLRHHRSAALGAGIAVVVLASLAVLWIRYALNMAVLETTHLSEFATVDSTWLMIRR